MKKMLAAWCGLCLAATFAFAQSTQGEMMKKEKSAKPSAASKSDAEIQKCVVDKLAAAEKLKTQGFIAAVTNGEVTLTGTAKNAGSKGSATGIAKSCGATKVSNNITAPPVAKKSDKSAEKKNN